MIRQALILIVISAVLGFGVNLVSPNRIDFIGNWRDLPTGDSIVVPPTAEPGDPPFVSLEVAQMEHDLGEAIFVDARDSAEFVCGTIPRSINIPFEYMPEHDLEQYLDSALGWCPKDQPIIIFCSGAECDLSLHLARNLQAFGYTNTSIFFGGSREWEQFGDPLERREECAEL